MVTGVCPGYLTNNNNNRESMKMSYINIDGVKVPTLALKGEVNTLVLARLRAADGWDGETSIKGIGPVTKEKLLALAKLFRYETTLAKPAVVRMSEYFGIRREIPADLASASAVIGGVSKKNAKVRLRRLMVSANISMDRRKVFCAAIAEAAIQRGWGSKVVHHGNGSYVNLWWDGRVPTN
jgi:hypothetical protein